MAKEEKKEEKEDKVLLHSSEWAFSKYNIDILYRSYIEKKYPSLNSEEYWEQNLKKEGLI